MITLSKNANITIQLEGAHQIDRNTSWRLCTLTTYCHSDFTAARAIFAIVVLLCYSSAAARIQSTADHANANASTCLQACQPQHQCKTDLHTALKDSMETHTKTLQLHCCLTCLWLLVPSCSHTLSGPAWQSLTASKHKPVISCRHNVVQERKGVKVASAIHDCIHTGHMLAICEGNRAILAKV